MKMKKGIVLVIVIGIFIVIATLSMAGLYLMTQQARIAEHQIKRMRALSAAKAGMVYAFSELRKGNNPDNTTFTGVDGFEAQITVTPGAAAEDPQQVDISVAY